MSRADEMLKRDFIDQLGEYICFAFDNEEAFMQHFFSNSTVDELAEFYMGSERIYVCVLSDGAHIATTIKTHEYINWYESNEQ